jgi:hypothetical protein
MGLRNLSINKSVTSINLAGESQDIAELRSDANEKPGRGDRGFKDGRGWGSGGAFRPSKI